MDTTSRSRDGSVHVTDERFNTLSHLVAFCFSVLGSVLLVSQAIAQADPWKIVGFSIYGLSLMTLFAASTLHHGLDRGPRVNEALRTLDYASVFTLSAGTVTPRPSGKPGHVTWPVLRACRVGRPGATQ